MKKLLLLILGVMASTGVWGQNGLIGAGFAPGWNSPGDIVGFSGGAGTSRILTRNANGTGNQFFRLVTLWDGNNNQWGPLNGSGDLEVLVNSPLASGSILENNTNHAYFINVSSTSDNYIFKTRSGGNPPTNPRSLVVFRVQGTVRSVSSVTSSLATVYRGQNNVITANLDGAFSPGQSVYLRYTNDAFATSTIIEMTGSGTTYTATIPAAMNTAGANIQYYIFTSGNGLTIAPGDADFYSINLNNNGGSNFSYTVNSAFISSANGNWNDAATWVDGVPGANEPVVIAHNVTLNNNVTISSLTINSGAIFTSGDGSSRTLTIERSAAGSSTTLTNNGTWANGATSTVVFTGAPNSGDAIHAVSGLVDFNNVMINKTGGVNNIGVNFGTGGKLALAGKLTIGDGGFVQAKPSDFYTVNGNTTLQFNNTGGYTVQPSDETWPSINSPASIEITSATVTLNTDRTATGNLTLNGGNLTITAGNSLTIQGALANANTITLEASSSTNYANLLHNTASGAGTLVKQAFFNAGAANNNNASSDFNNGSNGRWYSIGVPMTDVKINEFQGASAIFNNTNPTVYRWDAAGAPANYVAPTVASDDFMVNQGYVIYMGENQNGTFTRSLTTENLVSLSGTLSNAVTTVNLGYSATSSFGNIFGSNQDGWNLVSNPYLSAYNLRNLATSASVAATAYIYNPATGTFIPYNFSDPSDYFIAPLQAFWVRATAAGQSLTFDLAQRSSTQNPAQARTASASFEQIHLQVSDNAGDIDEARIYFRNQATAAYDLKYDAMQLPRDAGRPTLYTVADAVPLYLNAMPELTSKTTIPLNFQAAQNGTYEISIQNIAALNPSMMVMIEDKLAKQVKPLTLENYTFEHDKDNAADRFLLHFDYSIVGVDELGTEPFKAWVNNTTAYIKSFANAGKTQMTLIDMSGKVIAQNCENLIENTEYQWTLPSLKSGVYILNISNEAGSKSIKFIQL